MSRSVPSGSRFAGPGPVAGPVRSGGFTLTEALVVLLLATVVSPVIWSLASGGWTTVERAGARGERLDLVRTTRVVLGRELRAGTPGRDWGPPAGDSVSLRAFRGVGLPCGSGGTPGIPVLYRGLRLPDPSKDSVLALGVDGRWRSGALLSARPEASDAAPCAGRRRRGERILRLRIEGASRRTILVRIYERGSYHLRDGSLRYRRGRGGRQPLTAAVLDDAGSSLAAVPGGPVRLRLAFTAPGEGGPPPGWRVDVWPRDR